MSLAMSGQISNIQISGVVPQGPQLMRLSCQNKTRYVERIWLSVSGTWLADLAVNSPLAPIDEHWC